MTDDPADRTALVLGGGGITGIAWELGLLAGLAEAGVDLGTADLVVCTSAGSVVGAQITSGVPLEGLYERQLEPPSTERAAKTGARLLVGLGLAILLSRGNVEALGRRAGAFAIKAAAAGRTPSAQDRLSVIGSRLPEHSWPEQSLQVTAVDAATGEFRVLDRASGVDLVTAVAASCAVPGVYPPVLIEGQPHVDGGVRSGANVDVANGFARVVVLAPLLGGVGPLASPQRQADALGAERIALVSPDQGAKVAIGKNVLDPASRAASARAGRRQAANVVDEIRAVWTR